MAETQDIAVVNARLIDPASGHYPGGRLAGFYVGQRFELPGAVLDWDDLQASGSGRAEHHLR